MTSLIDYILSLFRSEDAARSFVAAPGRAMTSAGLIDIAPHQISSVAANVVPGLNLGAGDPMSGLRQAVAARHGFAQDVANVGFAGDAGAGVASVITTDVGAGLASGLGAGFLGQGGLALAASSGGFGGQVGLAAQVGLGFTAVIEAEVGAQVGAGLGIGTGLGAQAGMGFGGGVGLGLGGQAGGVIGGSAAGAIGAGVGGRLGGNGQIGVAGQGAVGAGVGAGVGGQAGIASQIGVSAGGGLGGVGNVSGLTGVSSNAVLASNASGQAGLIASEGAALNGAAMPHLSGPLAGVGVGGQAGAAGGAGLGFGAVGHPTPQPAALGAAGVVAKTEAAAGVVGGVGGATAAGVGGAHGDILGHEGAALGSVDTVNAGVTPVEHGLVLPSGPLIHGGTGGYGGMNPPVTDAPAPQVPARAQPMTTAAEHTPAVTQPQHTPVEPPVHDKPPTRLRIGPRLATTSRMRSPQRSATTSCGHTSVPKRWPTTSLAPLPTRGWTRSCQQS